MVPVTNLHLHVTDHHKKSTVIKTIKHGGRLLDIYLLWANKHEGFNCRAHPFEDPTQKLLYFAS